MYFDGVKNEGFGCEWVGEFWVGLWIFFFILYVDFWIFDDVVWEDIWVYWEYDFNNNEL